MVIIIKTFTFINHHSIDNSLSKTTKSPRDSDRRPILSIMNKGNIKYKIEQNYNGVSKQSRFSCKKL